MIQLWHTNIKHSFDSTSCHQTLCQEVWKKMTEFPEDITTRQHLPLCLKVIKGWVNCFAQVKRKKEWKLVRCIIKEIKAHLSKGEDNHCVIDSQRYKNKYHCIYFAISLLHQVQLQTCNRTSSEKKGEETGFLKTFFRNK